MNQSNIKNIIIVLVVFCILVVYLRMYQLRETFGNYKRRINGLYQGLTSNSSENWILDSNTHDEVVEILNLILIDINSQTGMKYYLNGIDNVTTELLPNQQVRYIVDVFVHELNSRTTKRMIIIMKLDRPSKDVTVETLNLSNAINLPEKVFDEHPNEANHSTLLITDENLKRNYHIMGTNDSKLEYSKLLNPQHKSVPTPPEFKNWILPLGIHECNGETNNFPCRKLSNKWDCNGIKYSDYETKRCKGIKNYEKEIAYQPYQNPSVNRLETEKNQYSWMFDLARGISGFPHGQSVGK